MPTVLRVGPYRFFFMPAMVMSRLMCMWSADDCEAKFWLDPVRLERSHGFDRKEINRLRRLVAENTTHLIESWNECFNG